MKKLFNKLISISQDDIERLITEKHDNDELIEDIINYYTLSSSEKALIDNNMELLIDEVIDAINKQDFLSSVNGLIERSKKTIIIERIADIHFMVKTLITKINLFNTAISGQYFKEMIIPFINVEKGNTRLLVKYYNLDIDVSKISKEIEINIFKILLLSCDLEDVYDECLALFKEISMYIILGERKLKHVITDDLSELNSNENPDTMQLERMENISIKSNELENMIFSLKQLRIEIVELLRNIFFILIGSDKLLEKICISINDAFRKWKVRTSMVIENKAKREYKGKMTNYQDSLSDRHVSLINVEDIKISNNSLLRKRAIMHANKELKIAIYELQDVCERKTNQIISFKEKVHNIQIKPQEI